MTDGVAPEDRDPDFSLLFLGLSGPFPPPSPVLEFTGQGADAPRSPHRGDHQRRAPMSGANGSAGIARSIIKSRKSSRPRSGSKASSVR